MNTIMATSEPLLTQHPISAAFPAMPDADFNRLKLDIKTNGQRLPIIVHNDQVLDGWHRYSACQQLGIDPKIEAFVGTDPVSEVRSLNLQRRHLTESQRAMVAAALATLGQGRPSTKKGSRDPISTETAAKALHVGTASVKRAKQVLKHGTPALVDAVKTGKVPVAQAVKHIKNASKPKMATTKATPGGMQTIKPTGTARSEQMDAVALANLGQVLKLAWNWTSTNPSAGEVNTRLDCIVETFRAVYPWERRDAFIGILEDQVRRAKELTEQTWTTATGA